MNSFPFSVERDNSALFQIFSSVLQRLYRVWPQLVLRVVKITHHSTLKTCLVLYWQCFIYFNRIHIWGTNRRVLLVMKAVCSSPQAIFNGMSFFNQNLLGTLSANLLLPKVKTAPDSVREQFEQTDSTSVIHLEPYPDPTAWLKVFLFCIKPKSSLFWSIIHPNKNETAYIYFFKPHIGPDFTLKTWVQWICFRTWLSRINPEKHQNSHCVARCTKTKSYNFLSWKRSNKTNVLQR